MRKIIAPCLVTVLCAAVAFAGGQKDAKSSTKEPVTINFTYWEGSPSDKLGFDTIIEKFEKDYPNIKVNRQIIPFGDKYFASLDTRIAGKDYLEVARMQYQRLGKYITAGVCKDITKSVDKADLDDLIPAFKSAVSYNGKLYAFPHHTDTMGLFYNKKIFSQAGIKAPTSIDKAWTWEEFLDVARAIKTKGDVKYPFTYKWTRNASYRSLPFLYMTGGALTDDSVSKATIDSPEGIEWLKYIETWAKEGLISRTTPVQNDNPDELFTSKVVAMEFAGNYIMSYVEKNMPGEWGVTYMPRKGSKTGSDMGGNALIPFDKAKHADEALIFIKYLTNAENMKFFCETTGFLPVRKSVATGPMNYKDFSAEQKIFLEQAATIDPRMARLETDKRFQPMLTVLSEGIEKLILGASTAEKVAKEMDAKIQAILKE